MNCMDAEFRAKLKKHFANEGSVKCGCPKGTQGERQAPTFICACESLPVMGTKDAVSIVLFYECGHGFAYHLKCAPPSFRALPPTVNQRGS